MSMEINSSYSNYKTNDLQSLRAEREKARKAEQEQKAEKETEKSPVLRDEYISSEQSKEKPSGLYRLEKDENGNPKISYDDLKKAERTNAPKKPEVKSDRSENASEECTINTDAVDREIEKLKAQKKQLEQQIQSAGDDEKKVQELERKLAQVESALSQKDNDTYRRQNAFVSG